MASPRQDLKVIIIGGGIGGVSMAKLAKQNGMKPTIIESKPYLGGKCYTIHHPHDVQVITEGGAALVAHSQNYQPITSAMDELKIRGLPPLPTKSSGVHILETLEKDCFLQKAQFGLNFAVQDARFNFRVVEPYVKARNNPPHLLPDELEMPFSQYAQLHRLEYINDFAIPFVTGFGYGHMSEIATYSVAEYMEKTIIPEIVSSEALLGKSPLRTVEGGFQHLVEKMAEDKEILKITSATITKITRSEAGVQIEYSVNGASFKDNFDLLINTLSPYCWPSLGLDLTPEEKACIEEVSFYPYTIGVASVIDVNSKDEKGKPKALSKEQQFFAPGLDQKMIGEIALFTTQDARDNPADGRFGTFYMTPGQRTLKEGVVNKEEEQKKFEAKLSALAAKQNWQIKLHSMQTWESYMSSLPWKRRVIMNSQQMRSDKRTVYVGSSFLGGFESTGCVASQAERTFKQIIMPNIYKLTKPFKPVRFRLSHLETAERKTQTAPLPERAKSPTFGCCS